MPSRSKPDRRIRRPRRRRGLDLPVAGMEAEFNVYLDGVEIDPRKYWGRPRAFISKPLLKRERSSYQIPTGGAVYFDRGVIEVVTPVIELGSGCAARMVRNLWEQIGFVRDELTTWEERTGHHVRLKAYSAHYNTSFEIPRREQSADRNIKGLALLLAYLLPVPVALVAANRRSTGVGVRPRGDRIEVTVDFTPEPALMVATASLVIGIVREVMSWPSYDLSLLDELPIPTVAGVVPGKHTTRRGWLTKDFQYPQSPFTTDIDARIWPTRQGRLLSLRSMARQAAWFFRHSIRRHSDPFSVRLLFAVLNGRAPSLLELPDRPEAYENVGRLCRWGMVIRELREPAEARRPEALVRAAGEKPPLRESIAHEHSRALALDRAKTARRPAVARRSLVATSPLGSPASIAAPAQGGLGAGVPISPPLPGRTGAEPRVAIPKRRKGDMLGPARLAPRVTGPDRRGAVKPARAPERRRTHRRYREEPLPFPDRRLTRSTYEQVFLKLVSGGRLKIGRQTYTPVGMRGWYHAIFRRDSDGKERLLTIDQLVKKMKDWQA